VADRLDVDRTMKDTCENCGKEVDKDFKFCPFCFHDFTETSESTEDDDLNEIDNIESIKEGDEEPDEDDDGKDAPAGEESDEEPEEEPEEEAEEETEDEPEEEGLIVASKFRITDALFSSPHGTVCLVENYEEPDNLYILRDFLIHERKSERKEALIHVLFQTAEMIESLSHDSMSALYEHSHEDNYLYLVYEYVDGSTVDKTLLEYMVKSGQFLPEARILYWGYQLADLLYYLHHHEPDPLYCGDLRPYSLVVQNSDFRLYYLHCGLVHIYRHLGILDSLEPWLAALGDNLELIQTYDLRCLGKMLYFFATGIDLFSGEKYVPLNEKRNDLSEEMTDIIERLLNLDENRTYQTIDEVRDALDCLFPEEDEESGEEESSGAQGSLSWRHYLGNQGRTNSSGEGPGHPLKMKWSVTIPDSSQNFLVPSEDVIISLSDRGFLCSINSESGTIIKKENMTLSPVAPIVIDDQLCICSSSSQLSLNIRDLSKKWEFRTKSMILAAPSYIKNSLCYVSYDGFLIFVNPEDGKALTMENINAKIMTAPVFDESRLYIPTLTATVLAIELDSRIITWQQNTKVPVMAAPSMLRDLIFICTSKGRLMALKAESGEVVWEKTLAGTVSQCVKLLQDRVFAHSSAGELMALNPDDGSPLWETMLTPGCECPFAVTEKYLYLVDARDYLLLIDVDTGSTVYQFPLPEKLNDIPLVVNDVVYVSLRSGKVVSLISSH
jgi:eukaryotic-like serine/threonine-protein kinase